MKRITDKITALALGIFIFAAAFCFSGCNQTTAYKPISGLDLNEKATITIAIPYKTNKAMNTVANAFTKKYPKIDVQFQYVENYETNAVKLLRENSVDIILNKDTKYSENTTEQTSTDDYYYNFANDTEIDFSNTTADISNNYRHTRTDADGNDIIYQYSYPLGGEMRGVFVNLTMLKNLNLSVPTNFSEFTACCAAIKQSGYIPIQGAIASLAYSIGVPYAANTIAHNPEGLESMRNAEQGTSTYFNDTLDKLYALATNRYMDYKAVENMDYFYYKDNSEYGQAMGFLGLRYDANLEMVKPENNYGSTAFFPYLSATETVIDDLIEEYGLDTEFKFITSPLNDSGSAPAYITPYYGVSANKNSKNLIWIREFVNFLFTEENMKIYAASAAIIPNTTDAMAYVAKKYNMNAETDITFCGKIWFSESYNGFSPISNWVLNVSKCNAQKYMVNLDKDESGNIQYKTDDGGNEYLLLGDGKTVVYKEFVGAEDSAMTGSAFCTKEYYRQLLEKEFAKYRVD